MNDSRSIFKLSVYIMMAFSMLIMFLVAEPVVTRADMTVTIYQDDGTPVDITVEDEEQLAQVLQSYGIDYNASANLVSKPKGDLNKKDIINVKNKKQFIESLAEQLRNGKTVMYYTYVPDGDIREMLWESLKGNVSTDNYVVYNCYGVSTTNYNGYTTDGEKVSIKKVKAYFYTDDNQNKKVDSKVKAIISDLKLNGKSDYEKVKLVYDYLVKNISYDSSFQNTTVYDAFISKKAVCSGYAMAFQRIMDEVGVPCCIVTSSSHMWNSVKMSDGKWYNIDATWGNDNPYTKYIYFLTNDDYFKAAHSGNSYCTAKNNYTLSGFDYKYVFKSKDGKKYKISAVNSSGEEVAEIVIDTSSTTPYTTCYPKTTNVAKAPEQKNDTNKVSEQKNKTKVEQTKPKENVKTSDNSSNQKKKEDSNQVATKKETTKVNVGNGSKKQVVSTKKPTKDLENKTAAVEKSETKKKTTQKPEEKEVKKEEHNSKVTQKPADIKLGDDVINEKNDIEQQGEKKENKNINNQNDTSTESVRKKCTGNLKSEAKNKAEDKKKEDEYLNEIDINKSALPVSCVFISFWPIARHEEKRRKNKKPGK